jgi:hypothetical protein
MQEGRERFPDTRSLAQSCDRRLLAWFQPVLVVKVLEPQPGRKADILSSVLFK